MGSSRPPEPEFSNKIYMCEICDHNELEKRTIRDTDLCPTCSLGNFVQPDENGKTKVERLLKKDFSKEVLLWYKVEIDNTEVEDPKTGKKTIRTVTCAPSLTLKR